MSRPLVSNLMRAAVVACALSSALAPRAASAGDTRPCSEPAVFQGAAVNSFVLPYRYVGNRPTAELEQASRQIAALVIWNCCSRC